MRTATTTTAAAAILAALPAPAWAAEAIDGAGLSLAWAVPFAGLLLSIALGPLVAARFWHHHYGKITLGWALAAAVPLAFVFGTGPASQAIAHALLLEYIPFIVLLFALFTMAGGVLVRGNIHGSPATNTALLAIGAVCASLIGTTGASMILIRPMIRANDDRRHNVHVVVFFIFLVSNIGGSLTPLGDPPLFVGFLRGVDFFWTTRHLALETLFVAGTVLAVFFLLDSWLYRREGVMPRDPTPDTPALALLGSANFLLIGGVIAAILMSALWKPGLAVEVLGNRLEVQNLARDAILLVLALVSLKITRREWREENRFDWEPIREVAKIFAGIFVCIVPVLAMLTAGKHGALSALVALVSHADGSPNTAAYFWLTGVLSSFLDNVPTYLVFFELAGGDARTLMGYVPGQEAMAATLAAISSGAVFMGANTYIGNAPNFMVYAIARQGGVKMPSFFGYMLWSGLVLLPIFAVATLLFFA
ncbi:sodium:proton antiporter [Labrys wisconsinensis]|uniref:Na+/H+ antiporter NhaD/arsenite permease-like protein n=1 Tax=Labrys wisconsinensis TaxID=425677 RepID=A0ABU0J1N1_9HYPH|nr:sodium:proton antiporter [Labrys wisconsinensis]MDQ0468160.1 Na+/H+ antiporter NhaD/arsenite permease-like protein [Labrys wisconsinensis]